MYPEAENPAFGIFVQRLNRALCRFTPARITVVRRAEGHRGVSSYGQLMRRAWRSGAGPDLIHVHYAGVAMGAGLLAAWRHGLPWVVTAHGSDIEAATRPWVGHVLQTVISQSDAVHFVSAELERRALALGIQLPPVRLVKDPGVDLDTFKPRSTRRSLRAGVVRLLAVGHLRPFKGWLDIIEAVAKLRRAQVDAELVAVGEGDRRWLRRLLDTHRVADRVTLRGSLDPAGLAACYRDADVMVVASHREGFGLVGLEAMAVGVPVVSTGAGGMAAYMRHEQNALLVPRHDPEAIARAVQRLQGEPMLFRRLVEEGHSTARAHSLESSARAVYRFYERVLARGRPHTGMMPRLR